MNSKISRSSNHYINKKNDKCTHTLKENLLKMFTSFEVDTLIGLMKLKYPKKFKKGNDCLKNKKSSFQAKVLEAVYKLTNFPSKEIKNDLSIMLQLPVKGIQIWFQNCRQAERKQGKIMFITPENLKISDYLKTICEDNHIIKKK